MVIDPGSAIPFTDSIYRWPGSCNPAKIENKTAANTTVSQANMRRKAQRSPLASASKKR